MFHELFSARTFDAGGELDEARCAEVRHAVATFGAVHVRETGVSTVADVQQVMGALGFDEASWFTAGGRASAATQQQWVAPGLRRLDYYPPHLYLLPNNEVQYRRESPRTVMFACLRPADVGGRVFLHSARAVEARLAATAPELLARVLRHGLCIETGFLDAAHPEKAQNYFQSWQERFGTGDRDEALRVARAHTDEYDECWFLDDGTLMTRITLPARWADGSLRFLRLAADGPSARNGYRRFPLGDDSEVTAREAALVRAAFLATREGVPLGVGDVVVFDNQRFGHSREPFSGPRELVVAMSGSTSDARTPDAGRERETVRTLVETACTGSATDDAARTTAPISAPGRATHEQTTAHRHDAGRATNDDARTTAHRRDACRATDDDAQTTAHTLDAGRATDDAARTTSPMSDAGRATDDAARTTAPMRDVGRATDDDVRTTAHTLDAGRARDVRKSAHLPDSHERMTARTLDAGGTLDDARFEAIHRELELHGAVHVQRTGLACADAGALPPEVLSALRFGGEHAFAWGGLASGRTTRRALSPELRATDAYPAHLWLLPHNEVLYQREVPQRLLFFSASTVDPRNGGRTFVHCARRLEAHLRARPGGAVLLEALRTHGQRIEMGFVDERHPQRHLNYFRSWQERFATDEPDEALVRCRAATHQFDECWWRDEGAGLRTLMTRFRAPMFHGGLLLFPRIALDAPAFHNGWRCYPRGDGAPFTDAELELLRDGFLATREGAHWRAGDLLLVDNLRFGHSREAYAGPRTLAVAMAGLARLD